MSGFVQLRPILATFNPKRLDTLRPHLRGFIGKRARWAPAWIVTEEDAGPYVGQWAFITAEEDTESEWRVAGFGWVPQEDLEDFEETGR